MSYGKLLKVIKIWGNKMRTAYEWETKIDNTAIENEKIRIRKEIKRIATETLRGNFSNPEDKKYWEKKLESLNSKLNALESM